LDHVGRRQPSRLGITYTVGGENGPVLIKSIVFNSAAQRAGLRVGDRIIEFDGRVLNNLPFGVLVQTAPKQVSVVFERPGLTQAQQVAIQLDGKPVRFGLQVRADEAEPGSMVVTSTIAGLPAGRSGLKSGDRIQAIGNKTFGSDDEFWKLIKAIASPTQLTIERDGRIRQLVLSVDEPLVPVSQK
jgi:C-terminal processing protease CtpA/Prc